MWWWGRAEVDAVQLLHLEENRTEQKKAKQIKSKD